MRLSTVCALLLCLVCSLGFGEAATAAPKWPQVVVLETRAPRDLPPAELLRLGDALWAALDRLGLRRVADSDREAILAGEEGLRACLDRDECQEKLGRLLEATHVIGVQLLRGTPAGYRLDLHLFDADVGQMGATASFSCAACKVEEVARQLEGLVESAVARDRERPRGTIVVRTSPPNAEVKLDGRPVGFSELERRVFAGPHDLLVSRVGLWPERMRLEVSGDQRLVVSLSLATRVEPAPAVGAQSVPLVPSRNGSGPAGFVSVPGSRRWLAVGLGVGLPLMLGGAAMGVFGGTYLYANGRCVDTPPGCTRVYSSLLPGALLTGFGAAAFVTGAVLLGKGVHAGRAQKAPLERRVLALSPSIEVGGAGAVLWSSF